MSHSLIWIQIVQLLGLDDHITEYPCGFGYVLYNYPAIDDVWTVFSLDCCVQDVAFIVWNSLSGNCYCGLCHSELCCTTVHLLTVIAVVLKAVFFPGVALTLIGEYDEQGSNYLATRLYGATLGGMLIACLMRCRVCRCLHLDVGYCFPSLNS